MKSQANISVPIFMTVNDITAWLRQPKFTVYHWLLRCRALGFIQDYKFAKRSLYRADEILAVLNDESKLERSRKAS